VDLQNSFVVPSDIDTAWKTLQDVEGLAPCMPGATLGTVDGDDFTGSVKVKLGPVTMVYGGVARFVSRDTTTHTVVIQGSGKETKGTGTAQGQVTATLIEEASDRTRVDVATELTITGKAAQFGRGVMQDVAGRIIDQFSGNLAAMLTAPSAPIEAAEPASGVDGGSTVKAPGPGKDRAVATPIVPAQDSIDLLGTAAAPVLKRVAPIALGLVALVAVVVWIVRRGR
jgi:carbon monoxide dehydrogenase subunit G